MDKFGNMKSNAFWGRRSGSIGKDGNRAFTQQQYGTGPSGAKKTRKLEIRNVNHKWFKG